MANGMHEITLYVTDIPMKLSEHYRPLDFSHYTDDHVHIPDMLEENKYNFQVELYALEVAEMNEKIKMEELERQMAATKVMMSSSHDVACRSDSDESEVVVHPSGNGSNSADDGQDCASSTRREHMTNESQLQTQNKQFTHSSNPFNRHQHGDILVPQQQHQQTESITRTTYGSDSNSYNRNSQSQSQAKVKHINPADFEYGTSSPFDFLELQTIDDMRELSCVFQAVQHNHDKINHDQVNHAQIKQFDLANEKNAVKSIRDDNYHNQTNSCANSLRHLNGMSLPQQQDYLRSSAHSNAQTQQHENNLTQINDSNSQSSQPSLAPSFVTNCSHSFSYSQPTNNLRSSKSVSDLPSTVNTEASSSSSPSSSSSCFTPSSSSSPSNHRERSHTPPCYSSVSKRPIMQPRQTLILDDPYSQLSPSSKEFVNSLASMGFDMSRVARAVKHLNTNEKKVVDFLLQVQSLIDNGYEGCEAEIALHMNNYNIMKAQKFLDSLKQLSEVGLSKEAIVKALIKCDNDKDKALDLLLNSHPTSHHI